MIDVCMAQHSVQRLIVAIGNSVGRDIKEGMVSIEKYVRTQKCVLDRSSGVSNKPLSKEIKNFRSTFNC